MRDSVFGPSTHLSKNSPYMEAPGIAVTSEPKCRWCRDPIPQSDQQNNDGRCDECKAVEYNGNLMPAQAFA
jgi:hypothetical protein